MGLGGRSAEVCQEAVLTPASAKRKWEFPKIRGPMQYSKQ